MAAFTRVHIWGNITAYQLALNRKFKIINFYLTWLASKQQPSNEPASWESSQLSSLATQPQIVHVPVIHSALSDCAKNGLVPMVYEFAVILPVHSHKLRTLLRIYNIIKRGPMSGIIRCHKYHVTDTWALYCDTPNVCVTGLNMLNW